jgi:predicted ATP-grasp superfamily ATP-dependent carboligase
MSERERRSPDTGPPVPALVLGDGITGLGVVRALGRAGIPRYVVGTSDELIKNSRWYRALPGAGRPEATGGSLAATLGALDIPRLVLIPCSDAWVTTVGGLDPGLAARFPASIPPADVLRRFVDKGCFAETLDTLGLPHPRTVLIRDEAFLSTLGDDMFGAYFLKPTRSRRFSLRYRAKGLRIQDWSQARRMLAETREMGIGLMLQEFIPGPPTSHYFLDGFVDRHGRVDALFARRRLRMFPPEFGNSTLTESIPLDDVQAATVTLRRLIEGIRYRGIFSAEFKRDERDGVFKVLEVNARPWWFIGFAANCGVNVALMAYRDALGDEVDPVRDYKIGRRCVYPRRDLQSRHTYPIEERPGLLRVVLSWVGAEQIILSWRDPKPGLRETFVRSRSWLRKRLAWRLKS